MTDAPLLALARAIAAGDAAQAARLIRATPALATASLARGATRATARTYFLDDIQHYVMAGDTALHVAAAAHRPAIARALLARGADVHAVNRRGAQPLHYAVDAVPGSASWRPRAQAATIALLLAAGADPDGAKAGGTTPLGAAVRNRCAAAVRVLLAHGADPRARNDRGSTPLALATRATGRGGSGSPAARAEQAEIVRLLRAATGP